MDNVVIGQIVLFLTTIVGFGIQLYKENRNRKWDLEDRTLARNELRKTTDGISEKIQENTQVSEKAFEAANNFSQRWAHVDALFKAVEIKKHIPDFNLEEIKEMGKDTNERVRDIQNDASR